MFLGPDLAQCSVMYWSAIQPCNVDKWIVWLFDIFRPIGCSGLCLFGLLPQCIQHWIRASLSWLMSFISIASCEKGSFIPSPRVLTVFGIVVYLVYHILLHLKKGCRKQSFCFPGKFKHVLIFPSSWSNQNQYSLLVSSWATCNT